MELQYGADGLIPAIVQHARSGEVLMLGYMNEAALAATRDSGWVTFWSRSRAALWRKGETSGNLLRCVAVRTDCDADALLVLAEPAGPTCHTGAPSCFHRDVAGDVLDERVPAISMVPRLADVIAARAASGAADSYTARLLAAGVDRIARKIGEEAAEVIIAAKNHDTRELTWELADLWYHALVLQHQQGLAPEAVWHELRRRHGA
ncbi:MAG: bifunctional phosphoribosyl-AMP cyclohydrolase/phosphoribosyl-ATP diphosphatase HisIE [Chloroflexi bacterium]|nr:bifunctional phosphoribosyl-AMP cyclohydrolase/phosphoribosyl-ATP diphosphatase HisIE [Chloroflexota bacterium]